MKVGCVDWAAAEATKPGEQVSGDRCIVRERPDGVLVAAIDGLGHGATASLAAERTVETLLSAPEDETTLQLVARCHEALVGTRGVVMSIGLFRHSRRGLTWIGVGNVEGVLLRDPSSTVDQRELLVSRGGVIGDRLPALSAALLPIVAGDLVVLATDGIRPDFEQSIVHAESPQMNADRILAAHARGTDDALVVVARYLEQVPEA